MRFLSRKNNQKRVLLSVLAVALTVGVVLCFCSSCKKGEKKSESATPEIEVATPDVDSIVLYMTLPGTVKAVSIVDVMARVNGKIVSQTYAEGDYVKAGSVLFTIEPTPYADAVSSAQAALTTAQSNYKYYSQQAEAMRKALVADAVSQMDVNQAENNLSNAEAAIKTAKAQLETAQLNLSYCTVRAPISGHITKSIIGSGNVVNGAGSPVALATIYGDDEVFTEFEISDVQYEKLLSNLGNTDGPLFRDVPLDFNVKLPGEYKADIVYVAPAVSQSTGTMLLRGKLKNNGYALKNGMFVSVSLPYAKLDKAMLVRDASIGTDQLGKYLYLVNDSNKVVYTPIEVGDLYQDTLRVVTKGITPKSRYVTKALLTVRNGETVVPRGD